MTEVTTEKCFEKIDFIGHFDEIFDKVCDVISDKASDLVLDLENEIINECGAYMTKVVRNDLKDKVAAKLTDMIIEKLK